MVGSGCSVVSPSSSGVRSALVRLDPEVLGPVSIGLGPHIESINANKNVVESIGKSRR